MAKVVDLQRYRRKALEDRAFGFWRELFGERFDLSTRLADLSTATLLRLATPGVEGEQAFYRLILGVLHARPESRDFDDLSSVDKMRVVDIHLFLADHIRFEMMRRAGWIGRLSAGRFSLVEMVSDFDRTRDACRRTPPELAVDHPEYEHYRALTARDREVFIRRMLPRALAIFEGRPDA